MPTADAYTAAAVDFRRAAGELAGAAGLFTVDGVLGGRLQVDLTALADEADRGRAAVLARLPILAGECEHRADLIRDLEGDWRDYWRRLDDYHRARSAHDMNPEPDKGPFTQGRPSEPPAKPDWAELTVKHNR